MDHENSCHFSKIKIKPNLTAWMDTTTGKRENILYICGIWMHSPFKYEPLSSREKSVSEVLRCYPELKFVNDSGKEVTEYSNKYWLMLSEDETLVVYPEKGMQK